MWSLRPSAAADAGWIAELRAVVLLDDLQRLGRYDAARVRQRFIDAFVPARTRVIVVDGTDAGSISMRPDGDSVWLEHFYLRPELQGRGIGAAILAAVLAENAGQCVRLNVLAGSPARRLYERHGFVVDAEDPIDVFMSAVVPVSVGGNTRGTDAAASVPLDS
ncbi:GNAT family N-acetyltransferase [Microbacterium sp. LTA6]|uniref:GNAT family N-acetyltransferase n=1 Tax=unclassified Microbacterium TaxID=2609290 RepID=UPI00313A15DE